MVEKLLSSLKKDGIFKTAKKILRAIMYKTICVIKRILRNDCLKGVKPEKYDAIILFENNFGWNKIMKQRPQQIAENFGSNVLFVYHSHDENDFAGMKNRIRKIKNNLYVVDFGYYRNSLFEQFVNHTNKYLMVYSTDYIPLERITLYKEYRYKLIYDYVDDIDEKLCGKELYPLLLERHKKIAADTDALIVTTATKLYNNVLALNPNAKPQLITNGVCYEHFKKDSYVLPEDLKPVREKYKTIIGYYGALASWFDFSLIRKLAEASSDYAIVLLGLDYDGSYEKSEVSSLDNVFYLGKKQYDELPDYVHFFDVCTIPFLINEITLSTSPVKLFEYMAANKPIVTTALPECAKHSSVLIADTPDDFVQCMKKAAELANDPEYISLLNKEALDNTWQSKCEIISEHINNRVQQLKTLHESIIRRLESGEVDRVIIWRSPFGWDVPLFQRPQHIANAFSKKRCLMIYEVTVDSDNISVSKQINDNLILANLSNQEVLDSVLIAVGKFNNIKKYIQIYSTNWEMTIGALRNYIESGYKILYEYIDDLNPALAGTEELPENVVTKYKYMLTDTKNILVAVTANEIEADILKKRGDKNYCFACNGVDYDHFTRFDTNAVIDDEYASILGNGKINIGYYGALASWFDYELIKKIDLTGKYNIVLFGVEYDDSYQKSGIKSLNNVYFLGAKKYEELPLYASKLDILTIPFVINEITNATSPLKLFEYMAMEKPIVTTAMPECKKYKSVMIADTHDEFLKALDSAASKIGDNEYRALLRTDALDNTWGKKADIIIDLMKKNEKA